MQSIPDNVLLVSILSTILLDFSSGMWLFKVNNGNIRTMCEICSKLIHIVLDVSIVDFEQVNSDWVTVEFHKTNNFFSVCVITRWHIYKIIMNFLSHCKLGHFYILPFPCWSLQELVLSKKMPQSDLFHHPLWNSKWRSKEKTKGHEIPVGLLLKNFLSTKEENSRIFWLRYLII